MKPLRLVIDVSGSMSHTRNIEGFFHAKTNHRSSPPLPLIHPRNAQHILTHMTGGNPHVQAIRRNTLEALQLLPTVQQLLKDTDEILFFVDSPGGSSIAYNNIEWIMDDIARRNGQLLFFTGKNVGSNAANLMISAPEHTHIHPLASTNFLWHLPTLVDNLGDLKELARLEGLSTVDALLAQHAQEQRYQMSLLFEFFGRRTSPALWNDMREKIYHALYATRDEGYRDHQTITQILYGTPAPPLSAPPSYKPEGEFTASGEALHQWGITNSISHDTEDLVQIFTEKTGISTRIGSVGQPWERFFTMQKVLEEVRAQGIDAAIDWDDDGDKSILISEEESHLQHIVQAIMAKIMKP